MALVPVKNVNERKSDQVVGATGDVVPFGATVEVPAEVAGKAPKGRAGEDGYEDGDGLLAMPGLWAPGKKSDVKAPAGDDQEAGQ